MKKLLIIALTILLTVPVFAEPPEISAQCAILICADTGDVLYEKDADSRMLIASTTKIMTAIVAIESCSMDETIEIEAEWCAVEGSSMYLQPGESYTVREILTGLMLNSGNDAATALAFHIGGSIEGFAGLMNRKAAELGMTNSSFENPHGLDGEKQYSSARDMAALAAYCMENDSFRELASMKSATVRELTYVNHNKLLWNCEGCIGIKTGYTMAAGRTLVSCCERNGLRLICVTLNAPDDWNDHMTLYDRGFEKFSETKLSRDSFKALIPTVAGIDDYAAVTVENDICLLTSTDSEVEIETELPHFVFAGALEGEKAGMIRIFIDGELAAEQKLVYTVNDRVNNDDRLSLPERMFGRPYYIG